MERDYRQVGTLRERVLRKIGRCRMQFIPMPVLRKRRLSVVFSLLNRGGDNCAIHIVEGV